MGRHVGMQRMLAVTLPLCFFGLTASAETDSRQAICQAAWESCLGFAEGKNWRPVYDRCLKQRTACLGGRAYTPEIAPVSASSIPIVPVQQGFGSGSDTANGDATTSKARCQDRQPRGERSNCTLADAGEGYGQNFSLLGAGVPMARAQRTSSVVKCAGGKPANFYPNGRIESCVLDGYGTQTISLTDTSGKTATCAPRVTARFDAEGRLLACDTQ